MRAAVVIGVVVLVALALVVVAVAVAPAPQAPVPLPTPTTAAAVVPPDDEDPQERNARTVFQRAQRAGGLGQWPVVIKHLDQLRQKYADTRFCTDRSADLAELRARAEAELEAIVAIAPPPVVPTPSELPPLSLQQALADWPAAFEDPLNTKQSLQRALLCRGQYGGRFDVRSGEIVIAGVHTNSAAWWNCPVGDAFALSFDLRIGGGIPCVWLCGPGYGNCIDAGYAVRFLTEGDGVRIYLQRNGKPLGLPLFKGPFLGTDWYRIDFLRQRDTIALHIDGQELGQWRDPAPLRGPMNAFVALGCIQGLFGNNGAWYRNLAIRMPAAEAERLAKQPLERVFDPPPTVPPAPNAKAIAHDDMAADGLSHWNEIRASWGLHKTADGLVLRGPNLWPNIWRAEPLSGDFAAEFEMSYFPRGPAINAFVRLRVGGLVGKKRHFQGWGLAFPRGDGLIELCWHNPSGGAHRVATCGYFAPRDGRTYTLRLEKAGNTLRVFSNGRFLLEGTAPVEIGPLARFYPGLRQIYGGSRVRRMQAWRIPWQAATDPMPLLPENVRHFGPRLAAVANFRAASDRHVRPILARRDYPAARRELANLWARPELRLAADQVDIAQADITRLERFWEVVQLRTRGLPEGTDPRTMPAADLLTLLSDGFFQDDKAHLQAALFLLVDRDADPRRALRLLEAVPPGDDARRYRILAQAALP